MFMRLIYHFDIKPSFDMILFQNLGIFMLIYEDLRHMNADFF